MQGIARRRRRASARLGLTPLIDVVFILMIFFMLASSFVKERQITLNAGSGTGGGSDATILLTVTPTAFRLNGRLIDATELGARIAASPATNIAIQPKNGATLQRLIDATDLARQSGAKNILLVE